MTASFDLDDFTAALKNRYPTLTDRDADHAAVRILSVLADGIEDGRAVGLQVLGGGSVSWETLLGDAGLEVTR